jgi:hypothetical protein
MTRAEAIARLPLAYAVAIRLRDREVDDDLVAHALGIDEPAVGPLLTLAEAKLVTLLTEPAGAADLDEL